MSRAGNECRRMVGVLLTLVACTAVARADDAWKLQPLRYNNPGLEVDLGVGLWAWPLPMDFDGDGDLDLYVGSEGEGVILFRNDGSRTSPSFVETNRLDLDDTSFAAPAFVDLDADGDDDVLLGTGGGGLWLYENRRR